MEQGTAVVVPLHRGGAERVGEAIRRARRGSGLSQCELAARLGCPQSTVSQMENAKVGTSLDRLAAVEAALGLPAGQLAVEAGYVRAPAARVDRDEVHVPAAGIEAFVVRWLAEFRVLVEAIEVLVEVGEPEALAALREVQPVRVLRASVDLWACLNPEDAGLGRLARHLEPATLEAMARAVWVDQPCPIRAG